MKKNKQQLSLFEMPRSLSKPAPPRRELPPQEQLDLLDAGSTGSLEIPAHIENAAINFCYRHYRYESGVSAWEVVYERALEYTRMCDAGARQLYQMDSTRIKEVRPWRPSTA